MKKLVSALTSVVAFSGTALAADMAVKAPVYKAPPPVAVYDWSGFYIGLNGGGGWGSKCLSETNDAGLGVQNPPLPEGCNHPSGGVVGGQVGYRWQMSSWVFGVEAQGDWANLTGSNVNLTFTRISDGSRIDAFGLFTGQVGYAWNSVLWYVKGGAAVTDDKYSTVGIASGLIADKSSETRWGGVIGTGIEFSFAQGWSVAFEYDHLFMGTRDVNAFGVGNFGVPVGGFSATDRIRQDVDLAFVRVNYRFGGPVVARY